MACTAALLTTVAGLPQALSALETLELALAASQAVPCLRASSSARVRIACPLLSLDCLLFPVPALLFTLAHSDDCCSRRCSPCCAAARPRCARCGVSWPTGEGSPPSRHNVQCLRPGCWSQLRADPWLLAAAVLSRLAATESVPDFGLPLLETLRCAHAARHHDLVCDPLVPKVVFVVPCTAVWRTLCRCPSCRRRRACTRWPRTAARCATRSGCTPPPPPPQRNAPLVLVPLTPLPSLTLLRWTRLRRRKPGALAIRSTVSWAWVSMDPRLPWLPPRQRSLLRSPRLHRSRFCAT